ncbi:MAG: S8 family serine peptidase [Thermoleophilaceae bacterium]|nr:S8 family serine peptidase [Thermoleophilaceae bacterium]
MDFSAYRSTALLTVVAAALSLGLLVTGASASGGSLPSGDVARVDQSASSTATRRVIVRFAAAATAAERAQLRAAVGATGRSVISDVPGLEILQLGAVSTAATAELILDSSNDVLYAEADSVHHVMAAPVMPDDALFVAGAMWGLHNTGQDPGENCHGCSTAEGTPDADIDAPEAWGMLAGCGDCVAPIVAVADSGVREDHEDLAGQFWTNDAETIGDAAVDDDNNGYVDDTHGWDWSGINGGGCGSLSGDNDPNPPAYIGFAGDESDHGTHVASTIAAHSNNSVGVAGVNDHTRLMNIRIGDEYGEISTSNELCGLSYAINNGARVVNGSYGGGGRDYAIGNLIAANPQVLFVFAAGNNGRDNEVTPTYPCSDSAPNIICVAASNNFDRLTPFSNYGRSRVDLAAPGDVIAGAFSEGIDEYELLAGTSMATPHVVGAASLLLYKYPSLTPEQVKAYLLQGVDQIPSMRCKTVTGGRLNAADSLAMAMGTLAKSPPAPCPTSTGVPPVDSTPPSVELLGGNRARLPASGAIRFKVRCSEACKFNYTLSLSKHAGKFVGTGNAAAGQLVDVTTAPTRFQRRKLRKALRKGRLRAVVSVTAADAGGNASPPARLVSYLLR